MRTLSQVVHPYQSRFWTRIQEVCLLSGWFESRTWTGLHFRTHPLIFVWRIYSICWMESKDFFCQGDRPFFSVMDLCGNAWWGARIWVLFLLTFQTQLGWFCWESHDLWVSMGNTRLQFWLVWARHTSLFIREGGWYFGECRKLWDQEGRLPLGGECVERVERFRCSSVIQEIITSDATKTHLWVSMRNTTSVLGGLGLIYKVFRREGGWYLGECGKLCYAVHSFSRSSPRVMQLKASFGCIGIGIQAPPP